MQAGGSGQFDVLVDDGLVFSKHQAGRWPELDEIWGAPLTRAQRARATLVGRAPAPASCCSQSRQPPAVARRMQRRPRRRIRGRLLSSSWQPPTRCVSARTSGSSSSADSLATRRAGSELRTPHARPWSRCARSHRRRPARRRSAGCCASATHSHSRSRRCTTRSVKSDIDTAAAAQFAAAQIQDKVHTAAKAAGLDLLPAGAAPNWPASQAGVAHTLALDGRPPRSSGTCPSATSGTRRSAPRSAASTGHVAHPLMHPPGEQAEEPSEERDDLVDDPKHVTEDERRYREEDPGQMTVTRRLIRGRVDAKVDRIASRRASERRPGVGEQEDVRAQMRACAQEPRAGTHLSAYMLSRPPGRSVRRFSGKAVRRPSRRRARGSEPREHLLFRIFLAIPALILCYVFRIVDQIVAFLGWFSACSPGGCIRGCATSACGCCASRCRPTRT